MLGKSEVPFDVEGTCSTSSGRSRTLQVLGTLAIAGLTVGLAACGDDGGGGGDSPEDLADRYAEAFADDDCGAFEGMISEELAEDFDKGECEDAADQVEAGEVEHVDTTIEEDGSQASIELTFEIDGEEYVESISAIEEDGSWVINE